MPAGVKNIPHGSRPKRNGGSAGRVSIHAPTPNFCRRKRLNSGRFLSLCAPMLRSAVHHLQSHGKPTYLDEPLTWLAIHAHRTSQACVALDAVAGWLAHSRPGWPPPLPPPGWPRCDAVSCFSPPQRACTEDSVQTASPEGLIGRWPGFCA